MGKVSNKHQTATDVYTVLSPVVLNLRANTPLEFDVNKHKVVSFKEFNIDGLYTLNPNGYYTWKDPKTGVGSGLMYSEGAMLASSKMSVVEYNWR